LEGYFVINASYKRGMYCYLTAKTVGIVELFPKSYKNTRTKISGRYIGVHYFVALNIEQKFAKGLIFPKNRDIIFTKKSGRK